MSCWWLVQLCHTHTHTLSTSQKKKKFVTQDFPNNFVLAKQWSRRVVFHVWFVSEFCQFVMICVIVCVKPRNLDTQNHYFHPFPYHFDFKMDFYSAFIWQLKQLLLNCVHSCRERAMLLFMQQLNYFCWRLSNETAELFCQLTSPSIVVVLFTYHICNRWYVDNWHAQQRADSLLGPPVHSQQLTYSIVVTISKPTQFCLGPFNFNVISH